MTATSPAKNAATTVFSTNHPSMSIISNDDDGMVAHSFPISAGAKRKQLIISSFAIFLFFRCFQLIEQFPEFLDLFVRETLILH